MDHKASLTRGAPVGGAATAYIVDEGMPCGTTIAIWAGLLLGALGTGFGAAGYAFSMENKDRLAEMTASSPPPSPSALSNTACLEQLFGGANTATNTFFPEDTGDYAPFLFSLPADGTTNLAQPQSLATTSTLSMFMQGIKPVVSTVSLQAGTAAYKATVSKTSFLSSGARHETTDLLLCSSVLITSETIQKPTVDSCPSGSAWRAKTYQITGSMMATGAGRLNAIGSPAHFASGYTHISGLWVSDIRGKPTYMFKLPVNIIINGAVDLGADSSTPGAFPSSFSTLYVQVNYGVYYDTYVDGKDVYATIRYVPLKPEGLSTKFYASEGFDSPANVDEYSSSDDLAPLELFGSMFIDHLKPMHYTHKINAQCASV